LKLPTQVATVISCVVTALSRPLLSGLLDLADVHERIFTGLHKLSQQFGTDRQCLPLLNVKQTFEYPETVVSLLAGR